MFKWKTHFQFMVIQYLIGIITSKKHLVQQLLHTVLNRLILSLIFVDYLMIDLIILKNNYCYSLKCVILIRF